MGTYDHSMRESTRYGRLWLCTLLLLSSISVLAIPAISGLTLTQDEREHETTRTTTVTITETETQPANVPTATVSMTVTLTSTKVASFTTTTTSDISISPEIYPGTGRVDPNTIPWLTLGLVVIAVLLVGLVLIIRSKLSGALEDARRQTHELRSQLGAIPKETPSSAGSALKRLLELGVLQPKEYMDKKILAERIEKKMSAKQLLDEGLISQEQYDTLTRKQE